MRTPCRVARRNSAGVSSRRSASRLADDDEHAPVGAHDLRERLLLAELQAALLERGLDVFEPGPQAVVHRAVERVVEVEREQPARRHDDERRADTRQRDQPDAQ